MAEIKKIIENRKFHKAILISCFIFSAICLLLFISQVYSFIVKEKTPIENMNPQNSSNPPQKNPPTKNPPANDDFFSGIPKGSPLMLLVFLFGSIISFFAGMVIYFHLATKEKNKTKEAIIKNKKEVKTNLINQILLPEEKNIINLLENNNGILTQSELVKYSQLNKLKVSRIIKKLASVDLVEKHPYGMTNKIRLKTTFK